MTTKVVPGQLVAMPDAAGVAREASSRVAKALRSAIARSGHATLALSGGNTPREAYALLGRDRTVDWTRVDLFWVDERAVAPTHERSNYLTAKATLLDAIAPPSGRVHRMPGEAADLDAAARDYEQAIREHVELGGDGVPAFDVVVLGIGDDGHTASLFPGDAATIDERHRLVVPVAARGELEARLTLTAPALEHARTVLLLAVGAGKRAALERAWLAQGDVHDTPARVVRGCQGVVTWIIDKAAGGL